MSGCDLAGGWSDGRLATLVPSHFARHRGERVNFRLFATRIYLLLAFFFDFGVFSNVMHWRGMSGAGIHHVVLRI